VVGNVLDDRVVVLSRGNLFLLFQGDRVRSTCLEQAFSRTAILGAPRCLQMYTIQSRVGHDRTPDLVPKTEHSII
jgi:hypothetical protein